MLALASLLVVLPPAVIQDSVASEDAVAVLEQLIENSASVGAFRARYLAEGFVGQEDTVFELTYLPPERLHMRTRNQAVDCGLDAWVDGPRLCMLTCEKDEQRSWFDVNMEKLSVELPSWLEVLERSFPLRGESGVYHAEVSMEWCLNEETDKVDYSLSVGPFRGKQHTKLGWLVQLAQEPSLLQLTEQALVQEHQRYRAVVSRRTGFLEELRIVRADGQIATIRLAELELDAQLDPADFDPPACPQGVVDRSLEVAQVFFAGSVPKEPRTASLRRIDRQLAEGEVEWRTQTRDACEELFVALYEPFVESLSDSYGRKIRAWIDTLIAELKQRRSGGENPDILRTELVRHRAQLQETLEQGLPALRAQLTPALEEPGRCGQWKDLLALEARVLEELLEEHLRAPLLEDFDSAVEEFLGG